MGVLFPGSVDTYPSDLFHGSTCNQNQAFKKIIKLFQCFSGSTGFIGSAFGLIEGLLDEVTDCEVTAWEGTDCERTVCDEPVCGETVRIRRLLGWTVCRTVCWAVCWTVCLTVCLTVCWAVCQAVCWTVCWTMCYVETKLYV